MSIEQEIKVAECWGDLGVKILAQAVEDASSSNGIRADAHSFLRSSGAAWLARLLGLDISRWREALGLLPEVEGYQLDLL